MALSLTTDASLTYDPAGDHAGLEGTSRGERSGSRACLFIESERGVAKGRVNLVFPEGYSSTDQLALFGADHELISKSHDPVVASIAPTVTGTVPKGCSDKGAGTVQVLHIEPIAPR